MACQLPDPSRAMTNTCYSFVTDREAMHVAPAHQHDGSKRTLVPAEGAGGVSSAMSVTKGSYAMGWARNMWAEALG